MPRLPIIRALPPTLAARILLGPSALCGMALLGVGLLAVKAAGAEWFGMPGAWVRPLLAVPLAGAVWLGLALRAGRARLALLRTGMIAEAALVLVRRGGRTEIVSYDFATPDGQRVTRRHRRRPLYGGVLPEALEDGAPPLTPTASVLYDAANPPRAVAVYELPAGAILVGARGVVDACRQRAFRTLLLPLMLVLEIIMLVIF